MLGPVLDIDTIRGKGTLSLELFIVLTVILRESPPLGNIDLETETLIPPD